MLNKIKLSLNKSQNILAVSKKQPIEKIIELHQLGQLDFGENYIQEALEKIEKLKDLNIKWHLIGPLQSNKVKFLKKNFEYIHSVDSLRLAQQINDKAAAIDYIQKIFLQINIAKENTKSGFTVEEFKSTWTELKKLANIKIVGLMTMPPLEASESELRIYFRELKSLADEYGLHELSMGTSHDYIIALEEGATWIRLGTILFGERQQK